MDASASRTAIAILALILAARSLSAAEYETDNFVVTAPDQELAKKVAMTAERWRVKLAKMWLGETLPNWYRPCPIRVEVGQIGAGGETTFRFAPNPKTGRNEVYGWDMRVQGTAQRILDSVVPHEVSHTIFASHFRRPLPRWADEGAATLAEHASEQRRQDLTLKQVWNDGRYPLKKLLSMTEYPSNMRDVMTLYAQGYSLADFLVQKGGRPRFLKLLAQSKKNGWQTALEELYGIDTVKQLESTWGQWVLAGSPELDSDVMVASAEETNSDTSDEVIRGQNQDRPSSNSSRGATPPRSRAATVASFEGFLPPESNAAGASRPAETDEKPSREPRPRPLGAIGNTADAERSDNGAFETGHRRADGSRSSLPRKTRVDAPRSDRTFFSSDDDAKQSRDSGLGGIGFPSRRGTN